MISRHFRGHTSTHLLQRVQRSASIKTLNPALSSKATPASQAPLTMVALPDIKFTAI
jgi:hypothetical protein